MWLFVVPSKNLLIISLSILSPFCLEQLPVLHQLYSLAIFSDGFMRVRCHARRAFNLFMKKTAWASQYGYRPLLSIYGMHSVGIDAFWTAGHRTVLTIHCLLRFSSICLWIREDNNSCNCTYVDAFTAQTPTWDHIVSHKNIVLICRGVNKSAKKL